MSDKDVELIIEVYYKNDNITFTGKNQIQFEQLIEQCILNFNIDKTIQNKMIFTILDDNGNIKRINNINDILKYSKEKTKGKYFIKINLEISENENNNPNNELNEYRQLIDPLEYEKELEKIKNEKSRKIKELEEIMEKMKKGHSLEIKKVESEQASVLENEIFSQKIIEEILMGIFKKEKDDLLSEIQKIKNDIISEIKKELPKYNNNNYYDKFDEVKKQMNSLNKNIEENINTINIIKNDLSIVKDRIEKIETNNESFNKKENNNENKINNDYYLNYMPFMNKHRNMNKIYKCFNCNNYYVLNECINDKKKVFKEHNFNLQNPENINDNKKVNLDNNVVEDKNNINKDKKNEIVEKYIPNVNNEENKEREKKHKNNIKNINEIVEEDEENKEEEKEKTENKENENKENEKEEMENNNNVDEDEEQFFNDLNIKLEEFFFYINGNLKVRWVNDNELKLINNIRDFLLKAKVNNNKIKDFLEQYINFSIKPEMEKLKGNYEKNQIIYRIDKFRNLFSNLNYNTEKGKKK